MDLLIRYGDALGAEHLCRVRNVAGTMTQPSPVKHKLVKEGGWAKSFAVINLDTDEDVDIPRMKVPTCQLQSGFGPDSVGIARRTRRRTSSCRRRVNRSSARTASTSCPRARPTKSGTCRCEVSTSRGWNRQRSSMPTRSSERAPICRGDRVDRVSKPHRTAPLLGQPQGREQVRRRAVPGGRARRVVPGLGSAGLLRRRRGSGGALPC